MYRLVDRSREKGGFTIGEGADAEALSEWEERFALLRLNKNGVAEMCSFISGF